jgi:hypothetical protein
MRNAQQLVAMNQMAFDLFRLSKSKSAVDLCPNTIRSYFKMGLPSYRMGKAVFVSRLQLQTFIVSGQPKAA